jgi:hypothetical protein
VSCRCLAIMRSFHSLCRNNLQKQRTTFGQLTKVHNFNLFLNDKITPCVKVMFICLSVCLSVLISVRLLLDRYSVDLLNNSSIQPYFRLHINIDITIMNIIHHPVFYLKHDVSETGFSLSPWPIRKS